MKKKIYKIFLDSDLGELWLDENLGCLSYIHSNDAEFRNEYHSFIIHYLGGKLISLDATEIMGDDYVLLFEGTDGQEYCDIIRPYLDIKNEN